MTIEKMNQIRQEYGLTYAHIAEQTGIPVSTVQKVLGNITRRPRRGTVEALTDFFLAYALREADPSPVAPIPASGGTVRESSFSYGSALPLSAADSSGDSGKSHAGTAPASPERRYTLEDFYALPEREGIRTELIDGRFYEMTAPATVHQLILSRMFLLFEACVDRHQQNCIVMLAPADVQLDNDEYTMVEPDLYILCDRGRLRKDRLLGAPDFVLEILSPSTKTKDMSVKTRKYRAAGVREYWMIDPDLKVILQYIFAEDEEVRIYGFHDDIPLYISEGLCTIHFEEVWQKVRFLYEE